LLAEILYADGYKIVAVSDSKGAIENQAGLNIKTWDAI
jgi:glutamate dehydrogenase/leucine dehydrogenase